MIELYTQGKYSDITPHELYNVTDYFKGEYRSKERELLESSGNIKEKTSEMLGEIRECYGDITWNINKHVAYDGKTSDMKIYDNFSVIGYSETCVIHIKLISDLNKLNYWDTMVEIYMERYLIHYPRSNTQDINDVTRYKGKKIITYVLILNSNEYKKYDDIWLS